MSSAIEEIVCSWWPAYNEGHEGGTADDGIDDIARVNECAEDFSQHFFRLKKMGVPTVGGGKLARYDPKQALDWFHTYAHQTNMSKTMLASLRVCWGMGNGSALSSSTIQKSE